MNKTFMRTTVSDDEIHCSWYDKNGKRRIKRVSTHRHRERDFSRKRETKLTAKETDNHYGFMGYAASNGYTIIDDAPLPHPGRITE